MEQFAEIYDNCKGRVTFSWNADRIIEGIRGTQRQTKRPCGGQ
jgi:hypothetical protein